MSFMGPEVGNLALAVLLGGAPRATVAERIVDAFGGNGELDGVVLGDLVCALSNERRIVGYRKGSWVTEHTGFVFGDGSMLVALDCPDTGEVWDNPAPRYMDDEGNFML